jgi:hypothetical protein
MNHVVLTKNFSPRRLAPESKSVDTSMPDGHNGMNVNEAAPNVIKPSIF